MNRHPAADAWQILLMLLVRPVAIGALAFVAVAGLVYCAGRGRAPDAKVVALVDTVRITDSVAVVRTDTVRVREKAKARIDTIVQIVDNSTVIVRDTVTLEPDTLTVHPLLVQRIRVDSALIVSLYARDTTRLWQIASRDKLILEYSRPRPFACGRRCGLVLGFTAGIILHKAAK